MKHLVFKKILLLAGIFSGCFAAGAQTLLDSTALDNLSEKDKPALLTQLAERSRINGDYKAGIAKAGKSVALALKFKNYTEATKAYTVKVAIYTTIKEFMLSKKASDTTLSLAQQSRKPIALAYAYYAQALFYNAIDNSEQITRYCQLALKSLGETSDPYLSAKIYYQLYMLNSRRDDVKNVNKYAIAATENALKTTDYNLLSNCYTALSVAADYNYASTKNEALRDSIIYYLNKAQNLYLQYPNYVARKTYAISCINSADYYLRYFSDTDQTAKANAIRYASMANEVMKGAINGEEVRASSLGILSEYAKRDKNFVMAEAYLQEAYSVLINKKVPYYYTLINVVTALSNFYEQRGNYEKALDFQKKATAFNNKYFDEKRTLNAQKLEVQYEAEKKNNEVKLLKQSEQYARQQKYLYIGIAIASILGLIFMFRSYHFRLRYSLQREKQLHLEKQDAELQMKLEKEEQARLKAEQLLLESQQQQLQKEVMASQLQLEHKKEMLFQIKEKLSDNHPLNINKIWNEELLLDNDFEEAKFQIQQVHPEFFSLLNQRAQQKLTPLDLKLCAYLHLKLDTKKIAQLMHVEAKSVRMSRYRIKQKLGLGKDEDLKLFLQDMG
ncbi:LuxR C-terminal-related transcriptional regulator [Pedobacter jeongneungensis]|uniref:LuxR C-terminal-related transcriptional regulator n=1 Tax=Pedobacter jeongneungensis TaxID=947309 RepID=A0ABP8B3Z7_9SPHI